MTATLRDRALHGGHNSQHVPPASSALNAEDVSPPLMDDDYWTSLPDPLPVRDLAVIFKIHEATVFRRLQDGTIPAHRIGGSWIVFKAEVRAWLLTRRNIPLEVDVDGDPLADHPDELGMSDLMELFGKTKQTVRAWLRAGTIPGYFLNGRWIAYKPEIRDLLAATRNHGPAPR